MPDRRSAHPRRAAAERVVSAEQVGRNLPTGVLERIRAVVGVIEFALDADITELIAGAGPHVIASAGAQHSGLAAALAQAAPAVGAGPQRTGAAGPVG